MEHDQKARFLKQWIINLESVHVEKSLLNLKQLRCRVANLGRADTGYPGRWLLV